MADLAHLAPHRLTESGRSAGCLLCDEATIARTAIDVVLDGDQIAASCASCGRLVRPFSWHGDDGLPTAYVGCMDLYTGRASAAAWYSSTGAIRAVPTIDPEQPARSRWAERLHPAELARAVLAHLVGIDVPVELWQAFETDLVRPCLGTSHRDWQLPVESVIEWLEANRC